MTSELEKQKPPLALKHIGDLLRDPSERGKDLFQEFFPVEES